MQNMKLPSEVMEEFLGFLSRCNSEYKECVQEVWAHDKKQQDQLHDLEFANNYDERCRIATRVHKERAERREYKDRVQMVEKVASFASDKQNKQFFDKLKSLIKEQKKVEDYLMNERHYNRRGSE